MSKNKHQSYAGKKSLAALHGYKKKLNSIN